MWVDVLDAFQTGWSSAIPFMQGIWESLTSTLGSIASSSNSVFAEAVIGLLPDAIQNFTLLQVMMGALVPVALVIFVIKVFVKWW